MEKRMRSRRYANLFYFRKLYHIGGTEQFLYEIAKKYHKYDIAILYDEADIDQLLRLRKLVRCIRRDPSARYEVKRAFYNFNIDAIGQVDAEEHIFIAHAIYSELGYAPPIDHPKITKLIGVSEYAARTLREQCKRQGLNKPVERAYNPLTIPIFRTPVIKLISACRLDDNVKGGQRTLKLISALDRYSEKTGQPYIWHLFTNETGLHINSPNVVQLKGRLDIRSFIADADWLVQLSNDMETYCYSINEALSLGTRIVRTPLSVAEELHIPKRAELVCDWDMKNVEEVAKGIFRGFTRIGCARGKEMRLDESHAFSYRPPDDDWDDLLDKTKSTYHEPETLLVQPIRRFHDLLLGKTVDQYDGPYEASIERAAKLIRGGFVTEVEYNGKDDSA